MPDLAVILPAAGSSIRFGRDKLQEKLGGRTVLERSIGAFLDRTDLSCLVLVGSAETQANDPRIIRVKGGEHRAASVFNGLQVVPDGVEWVAIHDAARPLVSRTLIDATFAAARQRGAAAPAMPVHLTIKQATGPLPSRVQRTVPRSELWALQTPQIARRSDLLKAFQQCPVPLDQVTDDLQLLELIGKETWLVPGEERNVKITTQADLFLAERYLRETL